MAKEIERKFLVTSDDWKLSAKGVSYRQGYLSTDKERTVRVRIADSKGFITVKGPNQHSVRTEFEYEIPENDAGEMLDSLCVKPLIEKIRYRVAYRGLIWEVDEFSGENTGLVVAEIELASENQKIDIPPWIGKEVTSDPRYFNSNLITRPYQSW